MVRSPDGPDRSALEHECEMSAITSTKHYWTCDGLYEGHLHR